MHSCYRLGTVNSKSFVSKVLLRIKWNFELTVHFEHEMLGKWQINISQSLRIKWKFELTVFELTVPDLYCVHYQKGNWTRVNSFTRSSCFNVLFNDFQVCCGLHFFVFTDINECESESACGDPSFNHTCQNTEGGFTCVCATGFVSSEVTGVCEGRWWFLIIIIVWIQNPYFCSLYFIVWLYSQM